MGMIIPADGIIISSTNLKLDEASRDYDNAKAEEEQARENAEKAEEEQGKIKGELDELYNRMGQRAVYKYKADTTTIIDMFLDIGSFEDAQRVFEFIDRYNEYDQELAEERQGLFDQLEEQKELERMSEGIAREQKEVAEGIKQAAQEEIDELDEIYDNINSEVAAILARRQASTYAQSNYSSGSSASSGIDWSGVKAPSDANDIVARAYSALGSPYSWGGVGNGGFDCSGLVSYCVSGENTRIGTTSTFMGYERTSDPQPGDIVTSGYHCGIYIGDGQMIHASDYGTGVVIGNVQSDMIAVKS